MYKKSVTYTPRTKTPEQALVSLMRTCARAERCSSDVLRSMRRWGLSESDSQGVLERLVRERFIDDGRYASAYVREKMRFSGWGERKIRMALRAKAISARLIDEAMAQLVPEENSERLEEMLRKKAAKTTARNDYELRGKLVRFAVGRGFDLEEVLEAICRIFEEKE